MIPTMHDTPAEAITQWPLYRLGKTKPPAIKSTINFSKMTNSDFAASKSLFDFGVHQRHLGTGSGWRMTH